MTEYDLLTFAGWLSGLTLMMWRPRDGARLPWAACVVGAAVWCALPLWEPAMRTLWHFGLTAALLARGLLARRPQPVVDDSMTVR